MGSVTWPAVRVVFQLNLGREIRELSIYTVMVHALNVALSGMKKNRLMIDTLNITLEIYKLFEILISS